MDGGVGCSALFVLGLHFLGKLSSSFWCGGRIRVVLILRGYGSRPLHVKLCIRGKVEVISCLVCVCVVPYTISPTVLSGEGPRNPAH